MNHYICTGGCNGESDQPGTCQAGDCAKHQQPLDACSCTDGQHSASRPSDTQASDSV